MRRREFISLVGGTALTVWPYSILRAQAPRPLIGFLGTGTPETATNVNAFLGGMRDLGYVEGRDFDMTYRFSHGDGARLPALANELVELKPTIILAIAAVVAKQATATIPIVSATLPADAIQLGLVASVPHPGGNVIGIWMSVDDLPGKWVELARELVPGAIRLGVLFNSKNTQSAAQRLDVQNSAKLLNVDIVTPEVRLPEDLDGAFQLLVGERVKALLVLQDGMFFSQRRRITSLATAARIPAVYGFREFVEDGGLISYGIDLRQSHRRAAAYVVKILTGTKPGDLPLEFPTKIELVINLKTAKALGLEVPPILLTRADEVIE